MKYRKIKETGLDMNRVFQLVNEIEEQEREYHEMQMNHEVLNND